MTHGLRVLAMLLSAACLAVLVATLIAIHGAGAGSATSASSQGFDGALLPAGLPARSFALVDQRDGARVSLQQFRGQVVIVTFLHSLCHDTCPIIAQQIRGALDDLGRPVPALAVSVAPGEDTPFNVRTFLARQHVTGRLRFLNGPLARVARVWKDFAIAPQRGPVDHTAHVFLLDRSGRPRIGFPASELTPESLAHDIRKLESERS